MTPIAADLPANSSYLALVSRFPLRPLRSEDELDRAIAMADELLDKPALDVGESDYLEALSVFIEGFETEHHPIEEVRGVEMLRGLMEMNDLAQKDLVPIFGSASLVSDVLAGRRQLSKSVIAKLAEFFHVSPAVFFEK